MGDDAHEVIRHRPLMELATKQHGVVATRQLAEIGYSRSSAAKAARVGRLHRIYRGVYVVGHRKLDWHGRCMAATLASPRSVASHSAAGWLWEVLRFRPETIHVIAPTKRRSKRDFVVHHATLTEADVTEVDGIPATSLARTYLDLAAVLRPEQLDQALERGERHRLLDLEPLEELLGRARGHPGRRPLERALEIYRPDPTVTRSDVERLFLRLAREAGLPAPSMNYVVDGYEVDAYWPELRFGVEIDVYATHGSRAAFERDRRRLDDLLLSGVEIVAITDVRLRVEPDAVVRRIAAHLERRRALVP